VFIIGERVDQLAVLRRIEKERNQVKTECEDLRAQVDQVTKAKVCL